MTGQQHTAVPSHRNEHIELAASYAFAKSFVVEETTKRIQSLLFQIGHDRFGFCKGLGRFWIRGDHRSFGDEVCGHHADYTFYGTMSLHKTLVAHISKP